MRKTLQRLIRDRRGAAHISTLIMLVAVFMLIAAFLAIAGVLVKQRIAKQAVGRALVSVTVQNYDRAYDNLIEGTSVASSDSADYSAYKAAFFESIEQTFPHYSKTASDDAVTYSIDNAYDQHAFTLQDLTLTVGPENRSMPDGDSTRLVYTVTGKLVIPLSAFGYSGSVQLPIRRTATYQHIG